MSLVLECLVAFLALTTLCSVLFAVMRLIPDFVTEAFDDTSKTLKDRIIALALYPCWVGGVLLLVFFSPLFLPVQIAIWLRQGVRLVLRRLVSIPKQSA